MKQIFVLILILLCKTAIAQVPVPMKEMRIDAPKPGIENENAGYYQQDGKYGFVYPRNIRHEAVYDKITYGSEGFIVQQGKLYGIAGKNGTLISKVEYDSIGILNNNYLVKKNGKFGTLSNTGSPLLSIKYGKIFGGNSLVSLVQNKKGDVQLVFNETEKIFPQKIEYANLYYNLAIIKTNGKFGVITDKVIVPFEYDSISHSISKKANTIQKHVENNIETRNVNRPPVFDMVVLKSDKLGLINSEGAVIYPAENDEISRVDMKAYYLIKKENLYSIYFTSSRKKNEFEFTRIYADGYGYVMAVKNNKSGVFNLQGEVIVPFEYDDDFIAQYSVGLRVTKNKKRGIIDSKGNVIVPVIYDDVSTLYNSSFRDFIEVTLSDRVGVVNLNGDVIVPVEFEWVGVENDFFKVATPEPDRRFGLYDQKGKTVVPAEYQWITGSDTENSKITILKKDDNSYNFLNERNELILPENISEYGAIPAFQALTFSNGKMRVIDDKGNYLTSQTTMNPHIGYKSFDELKLALIKALDSQDDALLKDFAEKIAPSEHILYYLKRNMFNDNPLDYVSISHIKERYYNDLLKFKHSYWSESSGLGYNRSSLTDVTDYTLYREGYITNVRNTDHAFGNVKYLEKFLRNAIKINGFWISSYFMKHSF